MEKGDLLGADLLSFMETGAMGKLETKLNIPKISNNMLDFAPVLCYTII